MFPFDSRMEKVLEIDNLCLEYRKDTPVVNGISLHVESGEILGIAGPSGSGKSLSMWAVLGLLPAHFQMRGTLRLNTGRESRVAYSAEDAHQFAGNSVTIIPQNPFTSLNPVLTCGEQIAEMLTSSMSTSDKKPEVVRCLETLGFDNPQRIYDAYPFELSGGQLQRVVIAMATISIPDLLIADEPTTALDILTQKDILDHLQRWVRAQGKSLILISHDTRLLKLYCDRLYVIRGGKIVYEGSARDISMDDTSVITGGSADYSRQEGYELCEMRAVHVVYHSRSGERVQALNGVSLKISRHEIAGLVGATGCGKSTIARVLTGLVNPQSGMVQFVGKELDFHADRSLRKRIQMVFQDPYSALYPHMPVGSYLREAIRHHKLASGSQVHDMIVHVLEAVGLPPSYQLRYPGQLSGGERQRVQIARAILIKPELLLCDEITSGLDALLQTQILELLYQIHRDTGMAILMISHDLHLIRRMVSTVHVMSQGRIVESGPVDQIFSSPQHKITLQLIATQY
jgi:ABC-type glutathione transport system ATPase component